MELLKGVSRRLGGHVSPDNFSMYPGKTQGYAYVQTSLERNQPQPYNHTQPQPHTQPQLVEPKCMPTGDRRGYIR